MYASKKCLDIYISAIEVRDIEICNLVRAYFCVIYRNMNEWMGDWMEE